MKLFFSKLWTFLKFSYCNKDCPLRLKVTCQLSTSSVFKIHIYSQVSPLPKIPFWETDWKIFPSSVYSTIIFSFSVLFPLQPRETSARGTHFTKGNKLVLARRNAQLNKRTDAYRYDELNKKRFFSIISPLTPSVLLRQNPPAGFCLLSLLNEDPQWLVTESEGAKAANAARLCFPCLEGKQAYVKFQSLIFLSQKKQRLSSTFQLTLAQRPGSSGLLFLHKWEMKTFKN